MNSRIQVEQSGERLNVLNIPSQKELNRALGFPNNLRDHIIPVSFSLGVSPYLIQNIMSGSGYIPEYFLSKLPTIGLGIAGGLVGVLIADADDYHYMKQVVAPLREALKLVPEEFTEQYAQSRIAAGIYTLPPVWVEARDIYGTPKITPVKLLAEQTFDAMDTCRDSGDLGPAFFYKVSLPGQLSGDFRFACLPLLLEKPGPLEVTGDYLTHSQTSDPVRIPANPVWDKSPGLTSFSHGLDLVLKTGLNKESAVSPSPEDRKAKLIEEEKQERDRLDWVAYSIQRTGLAHHAKMGTAPEIIPGVQVKELGSTWDSLEGYMRGMLGQIDLSRVFNIDTIESMRSLEIARDKYPEFPEAANHGLEHCVARVNEIIFN